LGDETGRMPVFTRIAHSALRWGHVQLEKENLGLSICRWGILRLRQVDSGGVNLYVYIESNDTVGSLRAHSSS